LKTARHLDFALHAAKATAVGAINLTAVILTVGTSCITPAYASPSKQQPKKVIEPAEVVIDGIVASVDDKPITLHEITARLTPQRKLTMTEAAKDPEALKVLDEVIFEKLLEEEAKAKRLSVADTEIEDYIREVAQRNNLSLPDFEAALAREGRTLPAYKRQVRVDILRAKLSSAISRGGISTTDAEIDQYLEAHPELRSAENTIKLHHIVVSKVGRTPEQVQSKLVDITTALEGGGDFIEIAQRLSDTAASSPEGSLLGVISAQDLSPAISEAVTNLEVGKFSKPVESESDFQVFYVEQRFSGLNDDSDEAEEALRNEVRQTLQKQKTKDRLSTYFVEDLFKNHAVDKRL
jgi:peptidyl-prolyl cis-trans isomerase SurA